MRRSILLRLSVVTVVALLPTTAHAFFSEIWQYLKQYELGIDYQTSSNSVTASYETNKLGAGPSDTCVNDTSNASKQVCTVSMTAGGSSGFGLFLQQAFKRQGLFYFKPDLGFGVRYLSGSLSSADKQKEADNGLPLTELQFRLGTAILRPYIQFGITPASAWPDLLISLGPEGQVALGDVSVNNKSQSVVVATTSKSFITGFVAVELVVWRFGKGALSFFADDEVSGGGTSSKFYPKTIDGMDNIYANFAHSDSGGLPLGFGLKLLLNWP